MICKLLYPRSRQIILFLQIMSRYGRSNRGGGNGPRQGAKQMTKNRFASLDPDIMSNYEDQEEEICWFYL